MNTAEIRNATKTFKDVIHEMSKGFIQNPNSEIVVELIGGAYYVFGSELDCLRLFAGYNKVTRNVKTKTGYSPNRNSFYFSLEKA